MHPQCVSRRRFLATLGTTAISLGLATGLPKRSHANTVQITRIPLLVNRHGRAHVVRVHNSAAINWDYAASTWYGNYVNQAAVDAMMAAGLCRFMGTETAGLAWRQLMPAYLPGQKIAVKVNLNNSGTCEPTSNAIDALIEPVNALISTLVEGGIRPEDVYVYDAQRAIPARFFDRRRYTNAHYLGRTSCAGESATFNPLSPGLRVQFAQPNLVMERWLADILYQATYVINMPIIKKHSDNPLTLGFKNHFGSLNQLGGATPDNPHLYIRPGIYYDASKHPVVDIYANANIASKTVLTIGDALFGASSVGAAPQPRVTFSERSPASLLFSRDPVAIDCVMADLLNAEWPFPDHGYDYLKLANQRGLGVFEKGDPWQSAYANIYYDTVEL